MRDNDNFAMTWDFQLLGMWEQQSLSKVSRVAAQLCIGAKKNNKKTNNNGLTFNIIYYRK